MYLVISTSVNAGSRSRRLARHITRNLQSVAGSEVELLDLSEYDLPMCSGVPSEDDLVVKLSGMIAEASGIAIVTPIYRNEISMSARNLFSLCGKSFQRKVLAFASLSGDGLSHHATLSLANLAMLEHKSYVVPDLVFATSTDLGSDAISKRTEQQVQRLAENLVRMTQALRQA